MRVVITTKKFHESGHKVFEQRNAEVRILDQFESPEALEDLFGEFNPDGMISSIVTVTARAIEAAPALRVIAKTGVGVDNIDVAAATRRRIPVMISFGANALSVAEHALGLMFALARNTVRHDAQLRAGVWSPFAFKAHELRGKRLGLVGFGQSAQHLTRLAEAIGMIVSVFAPRFRFEVPPATVKIAASLSDLLASTDIVSLHCPLNAETKGMIDAAAIATMTPGAWIVNTARGAIIDERALVEGLRSGHLGGAALDAFAAEPLGRDNPILTFENVVLTSHIAGGTVQAANRAHPMAANNVLDVLEGRTINLRAVMNHDVLTPAR